ncbi:MAG: hypothetical protein WDN44_07810 [Sphingomonas sp.]
MTKGPGGELTFSMADMEAESQAYQIVLAEWKAADATRHKRHGVDRSYALQARATDDLTAAERLVFGTPAPSLSAIADKVRLARGKRKRRRGLG